MFELRSVRKLTPTDVAPVQPLFAYAGNPNSDTEAPVRGLLTPEAI